MNEWRRCAYTIDYCSVIKMNDTIFVEGDKLSMRLRPGELKINSANVCGVPTLIHIKGLEQSLPST